MHTEHNCGPDGCDYIPGIKCSVISCVYHAENDCCEAGEIEVGAKCVDCNCSKDTLCVTYQPK